MPDLDGLPRSEANLNGDLVIADNPSLTSVDGLIALRRAGIFRVRHNDALTNLRGLNALIHLGGLEVIGNGSLTSLDGLDNINLLIEGAGGMRVEDNPSLTDLTAPRNAIFLGRDISIINNDALENLAGLSGFGFASANELAIVDNERSRTVDLQGMHHVSLLRVAGNPSLETLDGPWGLEKVWGDVEVRDALERCAPIALRDTIGIENIGGNDPTDCACGGLWEQGNCP